MTAFIYLLNTLNLRDEASLLSLQTGSLRIRHSKLAC